MNQPGGASFGPDGAPVYVTDQWQPGVDIVRDVGAFGSEHLTAVSDYHQGMRQVYVENGIAERLYLMHQQQLAQQWSSERGRGHATHHGAESRALDELQLLLLS